MSLTTEQSPLYLDIADVVKRPKHPYSSGFDCEVKVHTVDKDLDYKDAVVVSCIKILRDYVGRISDHIELELACGVGTYLYDIYPYLDNMEVSLYLTRQLKVNGSAVSVKERYKAVFLLEKNLNLPTRATQSRTDLNQGLPLVLTLQLIDRSAETLRIKTLQGSFDKRINPKNQDMRPEAFLRSLISEQVDKVLVENRPAVDKLDIEPVDNKVPLKAITIPTGTRLVELTEHLQTQSDGLYNAGVGTYIQRFAKTQDTHEKVYFVYSLYNPLKYHKSEIKTLFYCPVTSIRSIDEITYKYQDNMLKVLSHALTQIDDTKESLVMSKGSGYRTPNANSYMKKPVEITEEGPRFKRHQLGTEIIYKDRPDGLNFAPHLGVSSNHYNLNSTVLARSGKYVKLRVSNLDPDFIYPGAACKLNYETDKGVVKDTYGVIHGALIVLAQPAMNMAHLYSNPKVTLNTQIDFDIFVSGD